MLIFAWLFLIFGLVGLSVIVVLLSFAKSGCDEFGRPQINKLLGVTEQGIGVASNFDD